MATRKGKSTSSASGRTRSTTAKARESAPAKVWSEASVTVAVTESPNQYVKFTHGFERTAPNDRPATLRRVEQEIYDECEKVVNRRAKKLARIIKELGGY